jgi:hypothetical protein
MADVQTRCHRGSRGHVEILLDFSEIVDVKSSSPCEISTQSSHHTHIDQRLYIVLRTVDVHTSSGILLKREACEAMAWGLGTLEGFHIGTTTNRE